nr:hypothetical protein [Morchella crassipes]
MPAKKKKESGPKKTRIRSKNQVQKKRIRSKKIYICTSFGAISGAKGAGSWFWLRRMCICMRSALFVLGLRRISMHPSSSYQGPIQRSCRVCMHSKLGNMHASKGGSFSPPSPPPTLHPPPLTPPPNMFLPCFAGPLTT